VLVEGEVRKKGISKGECLLLLGGVERLKSVRGGDEKGGCFGRIDEVLCKGTH
jgi:hypothetical protein